MRKYVLWLAAALAATAVIGGSVVAQPPPDRDRPGPGGRGGRGGRGGAGSALERAVADLTISEGKRDVALAVVRAHQDNVGRMTELTSAGLLLKLKDVLSAEEFAPLKEATDKARIAAGGGRLLTVDDVVERIMSFDKNKDGKITKEELPERMQYLIEKGDTNKDGALDRDEIKKLATEMAKDGTSLADDAGGRGGRGGRGAAQNPGSGLNLNIIERAVGDLKLPDEKKEAAGAAIKAQQEEARKLTTLVRAELAFQLSDVLNEEQIKTIKAVLDRQPSVGERPSGRNGPPPGRGQRP